MKRTVALFLVFTALTAFAGQDEPPMPPPHQGMGKFMMNRKDFVTITKEEAKAKFSSYLSENLKGFEIKEVNSVFMPIGSVHQAVIADKNGNTFYLDITPDGDIKGPRQIKK